jgi:hypothetical protein
MEHLRSFPTALGKSKTAFAKNKAECYILIAKKYTSKQRSFL